MSSGPSFRSHRYSRPPSLSTIGSNEEADFSASRRNRQTFQSHYTVSPLEEDLPTAYHHFDASKPQERILETAPFDSRVSPLYSPAHIREHQLAGYHQDEYLIGASEAEKGGIANSIEKPQNAHTRTSIFVLPEMERSETGFSSQTDDVEKAPVKYMKTRYMWMLLQTDQIPVWHNLLAAVAAWIILAAYLVVPNTFSNFQSNNSATPPTDVAKSPEDQVKQVAGQFVASVNHLGLLIFSGILASAGAFFCLLLFFMHWQNYVWLSSKIFQPMMLNALAGLLTVVVSTTTKDGGWQKASKINAAVTGGVAAIAGALFLFYNFVLLARVKAQHRKHFPVDAELVDPMKANRFNQKVGRYLPPQKGY